MNKFAKIIGLVDLFYKLAAFPSRRDIIKNTPKNSAKMRLIRIIDDKLSKTLQNKAAKYWGMLWELISEKVSKQGNANNKLEELIDDAIEVFKQFEGVYKHLDKKDVQQYSNFYELKDVVFNFIIQKQQEQIKKQKDKKNQKLMGGVSNESVNESLEKGHNTKIYEDNEIAVFRINSAVGAHALASDTSWCVARLHQPYYNQYISYNIVFYFVVNKKLPLNDPYQKMAIRVVRDGESNDIIEIKATRKTNDGDDFAPEQVPDYDKFKDILLNDAQQQPEGLLSKVKRGAATEDEIIALWNSNKLASVEEKLALLKIIPSNIQENIKEIDAFSQFYQEVDEHDPKHIESFILNEDLNDFNAATLELYADSYSQNADAQISERALLKLWKTQYPNVQSHVAKKTKNPSIIASAAMSPFEEVQYKLIFNKNLNDKIKQVLLYSEFEEVSKTAQVMFKVILEDNNIISIPDLSIDEKAKFLLDGSHIVADFMVFSDHENLFRIIQKYPNILNIFKERFSYLMGDLLHIANSNEIFYYIEQAPWVILEFFKTGQRAVPELWNQSIIDGIMNKHQEMSQEEIYEILQKIHPLQQVDLDYISNDPNRQNFFNQYLETGSIESNSQINNLTEPVTNDIEQENLNG